MDHAPSLCVMYSLLSKRKKQRIEMDSLLKRHLYFHANRLIQMNPGHLWNISWNSFSLKFWSIELDKHGIVWLRNVTEFTFSFQNEVKEILSGYFPFKESLCELSHGPMIIKCKANCFLHNLNFQICVSFNIEVFLIQYRKTGPVSGQL